MGDPGLRQTMRLFSELLFVRFMDGFIGSFCLREFNESGLSVNCLANVVQAGGAAGKCWLKSWLKYVYYLCYWLPWLLADSATDNRQLTILHSMSLSHLVSISARARIQNRRPPDRVLICFVFCLQEEVKKHIPEILQVAREHKQTIIALV